MRLFDARKRISLLCTIIPEIIDLSLLPLTFSFGSTMLIRGKM